MGNAIDLPAPSITTLTLDRAGILPLVTSNLPVTRTRRPRGSPSTLVPFVSIVYSTQNRLHFAPPCLWSVQLTSSMHRASFDKARTRLMDLVSNASPCRACLHRRGRSRRRHYPHDGQLPPPTQEYHPPRTDAGCLR